MTKDPAAYRLRSLIGQLRMSRSDAAALLRSVADEMDPAVVSEHLHTAAQAEAERLREAGFTVTSDLQVQTLAAAHVLNRSSKTLRNWRAGGAGPAWRSVNNLVWYSLPVLIAWRSGADVPTCPEISPVRRASIQP